jgi:hypothetical protein
VTKLLSSLNVALIIIAVVNMRKKTLI